MTATPTTEVALVDPVFSNVEQYALAAFLAGYRGLTRDAYALDLRQFVAWCEEHDVRLFAARPCRHRVLRPRPRSTSPGTSDCRPPAVHGRRLLPLRRTGGAARTVP